MPIVTLPKGSAKVKLAAAAPDPPVPLKLPKILSPADTQLPATARKDPCTTVPLETTSVVPVQLGTAYAGAEKADRIAPATIEIPTKSFFMVDPLARIASGIVSLMRS